MLARSYRLLSSEEGVSFCQEDPGPRACQSRCGDIMPDSRDFATRDSSLLLDEVPQLLGCPRTLRWMYLQTRCMYTLCDSGGVFGRKDVMYINYPRVSIQIGRSNYIGCYSTYYVTLTFFLLQVIVENFKFYLFNVYNLMI